MPDDLPGQAILDQCVDFCDSFAPIVLEGDVSRVLGQSIPVVLCKLAKPLELALQAVYVTWSEEKSCFTILEKPSMCREVRTNDR